MATSAHGHGRLKVTWYALAAGILWWAVHISGMAALVPYSCSSGTTLWLHLLSGATAVLTVHGMWLGWRTWRAGDVAEGLSYVGAVAVLVCLTGLVAILAEWVPVFLIDVCAG